MPDDTRPNAGPPGSQAERHEAWQDAEFERLVADIEARLRQACAHLPADEFTRLVRDIARIRRRFDAMDPLTPRPKRPNRERPPP